MKKILIISAALLIIACTAKKAVTTPVTNPVAKVSDVDRGAQKFPGYTQANFDEGKKLYEANCGLCHGLKTPSEETEEVWRREVPPMVRKANRKMGSEAIDAAKQDLILKYVVTMCSAK